MSRGARIVLVAAAVFVSASVLMAGAGAVYVYRDGMIDVHVREKVAGGSNVHVFVPTSLVRLVLAFVPLSDDMRPGPDARKWWPVVEAACSGIARSPDGVLVEVDGPDHRVAVRKEDGRLVVDVDDADARVHVSIPLRAVDAVVRRFRPSGHTGGPKGSITFTKSATPSPDSPRA